MDEAWYIAHNIGNQLKAALETAIVGQGLSKAFPGLETGTSTVVVIYTGETCTFYPQTPPLTTQENIVAPVPEVTLELPDLPEEYPEENEPQIVSITDAIVQDATDAVVQEAQAPKPKRKR